MNASYVPMPRPCTCEICKEEILNERPTMLEGKAYHKDCFDKWDEAFRFYQNRDRTLEEIPYDPYDF
jgi:hypothetical protein